MAHSEMAKKCLLRNVFGIALAGLLFWAQIYGAQASAPISKFFTFDEYRTLLQKYATQVNLFRDAWKINPRLQFTGGTVRDYSLWFEKQFHHCSDRACAEEILKKLDDQPSIDVRGFILEDSDVDAAGETTALKASDYGIHKIDYIEADELKAGTRLHQSALDQGYIPVERVVLGKNTLAAAEGFGNGLRELYEGKLTVYFTEASRFWRTVYAARRENHPILLVERYLRVVSLYYNSMHPNGGYPDKAELLSLIDPATQRAIRSVVNESIHDPRFTECLKQPRFRSWHEKTVLKAFRAWTNPTATYLLFTEFGVDKLLKQIHGAPPINQFLFAQPRRQSDLELFQKRLAQFGFSEDQILEKTPELVPGLVLYHGTRTDIAFRDILLRGVFESESGSAGRGLYAVTERSREFSESWGGNKNNLVSFMIDPKTRVVSHLNPGFRRLEALFAKQSAGDADFFAYFGFDAYKYPYGETDALVVKNSGVLQTPRGVYRSVLTIQDLFMELDALHLAGELEGFLQNFFLNTKTFNEREKSAVLRRLTDKYGQDWLDEAFRIVTKDFNDPDPWADFPPSFIEFLSMLPPQGYQPAIDLIKLRLKNGFLGQVFSRDVLPLPVFQNHPEIIEAVITSKLNWSWENRRSISALLGTPGWERYLYLLEALIREGDVAHNIPSDIFSKPHWKDQHELFLTFIKRGDARTNWSSIAEFALSQEHWKEHPELVVAFLQKTPSGDRGWDWYIDAYVLRQPFWKNNTKLREMCGGQDPTAKLLRSNLNVFSRCMRLMKKTF